MLQFSAVKRYGNIMYTHAHAHTWPLNPFSKVSLSTLPPHMHAHAQAQADAHWHVSAQAHAHRRNFIFTLDHIIWFRPFFCRFVVGEFELNGARLMLPCVHLTSEHGSGNHAETRRKQLQALYEMLGDEQGMFVLFRCIFYVFMWGLYFFCDWPSVCVSEMCISWTWLGYSCGNASQAAATLRNAGRQAGYVSLYYCIVYVHVVRSVFFL